jgi:hypothetical protein
VGAIESGLDALQHDIEIAQHLAVADSNDAQTQGCEEAIALHIELATSEGNPAVDFHHPPSLGAIKVGDEPIDDELPSKPDSPVGVGATLTKAVFPHPLGSLSWLAPAA